MASKSVDYKIGFTVDKSGLSQMQSLFQQIANSAKEPGNQLKAGLQQAAATANTLDGILEKTFNTNLGTLNVTKFNQELSKSGLTLKTVQADLAKAGNQGATAYNRLAQAVLGTNLQLKESNKLLDSMAVTMANTVKWGITSSIFNTITNSIQKAYTFSKQLDTSLNDIRIVTDKSADSMARFAIEANEAAKGLGASTLDYTNASLIYYQQGLTDAEVAARAETTIKAANVTGQRGEEVSDQLTAVWNGYKVSAEETEVYVDKLAAVAATTAADLEELSKGMSKVAAAANTMGVDFDDLNAQIATIVSVTRQAPESVGTALKTIYARLGDLKVDGVDEFGVKLGEVSSQMQTMGIQILDQQGNLRDMSSVIAEVAQKWGTWTEAQRQAVAVAMAGKRQYNNLIALFDNWDMYTDALNTSVDALGTLQEQQDIYMESTAAKLKTLKATWQDLYGDLINEDELNAGIEGLTNLVQVFDNFIESFGGGLKSIAGFGTIVSSVFNKQIADAINNVVQRQEVFKQNLALAQANAQIRENGIAQLGDKATPQDLGIQANTKLQLEYAQKIYDIRLGLNQEQYNTLTNYQKELGALQGELTYIEEYNKKSAQKYLNEEMYNEILKQGEEAVFRIEEYYDDYINNTKILKNEIKEIVADEINIGAAKAKIASLSQLLNKEEKEELQNVLALFKTNKDLINGEEQILKILDQQISKYKTAQQVANKINENRIKGIDLQSSIQNTKQEADALLLLGKNATTTTERITILTSTLSSFAMTWSSISSLIKTINDDSISVGDKLTQGFMTLGMTLPMIISSFNKLNEVINIQNTLSDIFNAKQITEISLIHQRNLAQDAELAKVAAAKAQKEANIALSQLSCLQDEKEVALIWSKISAEEIEAVATGKLTVEEVANNIANKEGIFLDGVQLNAIKSKILAKYAEVVATKAQTVATEEATVAQWSLNAAMAANPIGVIILAITALVAAVAGTVAIYDALTVSAEEAAEALEKSIETYNEEKEKLKSLEDELDSTQKKIDELNNSGPLSLVQEKELRNLKIHNDYLQMEVEAQKELLKLKQEEVAQDAKQSALKNSFSTEKYKELSSGVGVSSYMGSSEYQLSGNYATFEDMQADIEKQRDKAIKKATNESLSDTDRLEAQGAVEYYNNLLEQKDEILNKWNDAIDQLKEGFNKSQEVLPSLYALVTDENGNYDDENKFSDIIKYYEQINLNYLEASGTLEKSLQRVMEETFKNNNEMKDFFQQADAALDKENQVVNEEILKGFLTGDQFTLLQEWAQTFGISLYDILIKAKEFNITLKDNIEEVNNSLEAQQAKVDEFLGYLNTALSAMTKNGKLTKKELEEMKDALTALEEEYPSLAAIQDRESTAYYNKLLEIREALEEQDKLLAQQQENQKIDEAITIDVKSDGGEEDLEEKLLDICNADYEVLVSIKSDVQTDFDTAVNATEAISEMASKIGDDFVVAAEDIEELNNVFPGILANMELVGDGTVKLNAEIVKGAMEVAEAEVAADTDATISKLQNQADELLAKRDAAREIAISATKLAEQETTLDNEKGKIDTALNQLKTDNSETTSQNQQKDQGDVAENAAIAATSMANSFEGAYKNMAENAIAWANVAYQAFQAAQGKANPPSINDFAGTSFQSTSNVKQIQSEKSDLNNFEDYADVGDWQEVADYYNNLANSYDEAYNSVLGKIGELTARGQKVGKTLNNISKGLGSDGKKGKGGGKDKKDKDEKEYRDEFDRYWEIKKAIDSVDKALSKLSKDQKNLFGYQLIDSLKKTNKLLDEQAANYERLAAAQEVEAAELRGQLGTMGVIFDASGAITNYAAATAQALAAYNDAIQKYNAGLIDETQFGVYEKAFENFKKLLERYDALYYKEIQETKEKLDDIRREKLANNLKAWEVKVDIKLNWQELERGWNDFLKEIREDFKKVYKDLRVEVKNLQEDAKTYLGKDGSIGVVIKAIQDVTKEIDKMRAGGVSSMFESISQAQEKLKELNEKLQDSAKGLHDLWKEAWDAYLEGIEQVSDKFDDLLDQFDRMNDELEFQGQLIELLYGEKAYDLMSKLYKGQEQSIGNQLESVKQQAEMWEKLWRDSGATMENQSDWTEDQKKYYDQWMEAQEKLNDLIIDYIKVLKNDYLNTIEQVLYELEKSLTGSSLQDIKTQWERISAYSDKYLDDVEQAYETQKLANKINEAIANTSNLKNQQKLQAFRDKEIKYLREKETLTQYDLDAAEARYQIALKEMALEDARNNKTSMKLVRNEQGNWSYQYLADEEDVMSKQQELLDAYSNLYQLASDAYESNLEALQELQEKYLESAREIYTDETLSEEEKQQKLLELRNWYLEQYKLLAEENTLYRNDLATSSAALLLEIYEQDKEAYTAMTEEERELVDALVDANIEDYMDLEDKLKENYKNIGDKSKEVMAETRADWTSTAQQLADLWNKDAGGSVRYEVVDAYNKIVKATEEYKKKLDWLAETAERNFGPEGISGAIEDAANATDDLKDRTENLVNDGVEYLDKLKDAVEKIEEAWNKVKDAIEDAIKTLEEYLRLRAEAGSEEGSSGGSTGGGSGGITPGSGSGDSGGSEGSKKGNGSENQPSGKKANYYVGYRESTGNAKPTIVKNDLTLEEAQEYVNTHKSSTGSYFVGHYDTGGYTGTWNGNDGRLAMLHQKELVLNKDDTANFLEGINTIRDMSSMNGSISKAVMQAVANMTLAIGRTKAGNVNGTVVNETNQAGGDIFNITAEFPNANDVNDIREAIMSLPNLASQFVARNGK